MKLFFSIVLIIMSLYSFYHNYNTNSLKANTKNNWIKTSGTVTNIKLLSDLERKSNVIHYYVAIDYTYNINNTTHIGKAIEFLYSSKSKTSNEELIDLKYKKDMIVDIYYNKFDLNTSVINDKLLEQNYLGYIYGVVFLLLLVFIRNF